MQQNKVALLLVGPSGSGKTTVENAFVERYDFVKLVSSTTRPKRNNEVDGINYNFLSTEEFEEMIRKDGFIEYTRFGDNYYGMPKSAIKNDSDVVCVVEPSGVGPLSEFVRSIGITPIAVYLHACDEVRRDRMVSRGDGKIGAEHRLQKDDIAARAQSVNFDYKLDTGVLGKDGVIAVIKCDIVNRVKEKNAG